MSRLKIDIPDDVREICLELAQQDFERFRRAKNTIVLDASHEWGLFRGLVGQWVVGQWLGVPWRLEPVNSRYDLMSKKQSRVDVKTSGFGNPLMVPLSQRYKIDPERVDIFVLVWFDGKAPYAEIPGWIRVAQFLECMRREIPPQGKFPYPTLYVPLEELESV